MHRQAQVTGSRRQRSSGERVRDEAMKQTDLMGKQVRKQPDGLREKKKASFFAYYFSLLSKTWLKGNASVYRTKNYEGGHWLRMSKKG